MITRMNISYTLHWYIKQKTCNRLDCKSSVGSDGFEPPKLEAADLQSAPFGHSGNYPLVGVDGFEPPTLCL